MLKFLLSIIRPVCPACNGEGGAMSGYYEPEFSECSCCYEAPWWEDANPTRVWRWRCWTWRYQEWRTARHWEQLYAEEEKRATDMRTRDLPDRAWAQEAIDAEMFDDDQEEYCGQCDEGYTYHCIDGCCINAEDGCELCQRRCDFCNPFIPTPAQAEERAKLGEVLADALSKQKL